MNHKAGFVNILGNPNVGKSTLLNVLINEKLAIITPKAQTTRHRIMGIINGEDYQIVYSDTPGILKPRYLLHQSMMNVVSGAMSDADVYLYVTDHSETIENINQEIFEKLKNANAPLIFIINKKDLIRGGKAEIERREKYWKKQLNIDKILSVSALKKEKTAKIIESIVAYLPEHPAYYPKDELTDRSLRFFVSEIIREKIFMNYEKEIPYCCEVIIDSFKEETKITKIAATIYVTRDSQKGILIGHKGGALKKVGTQARIDMEEFLGIKVFLELHVKVGKEWRDNERFLKQFGY